MGTTIIHQNQSKKMRIALNIVIMLLLLLWIPVSIDKILNFAIFKTGILTQPFPNHLGYTLIYTLPIVEVITAITLITERFRKIGLMISTILMIVFTGYIGIALLGAWTELPCGCGSVINGMNWTVHFYFNLFFLTLSIVGLNLWHKIRGSDAGSETTEGESAKRQIKDIIERQILRQ